MNGTEAVSETILGEKPWTLWRPTRYWWEIVISSIFDCLGSAPACPSGGGATDRRAGAQTGGGPIAEEGERPVSDASRFDGRRQGGMPEGAFVQGRLIGCASAG